MLEVGCGDYQNQKKQKESLFFPFWADVVSQRLISPGRVEQQANVQKFLHRSMQNRFLNKNSSRQRNSKEKIDS